MVAASASERSLFHIVHIDELASILVGGCVPCKGDSTKDAPRIWAADFDAMRQRTLVPLGHRPSLSEFVPLHVTSRPPALLKRMTFGGAEDRLAVSSVLLFETSAKQLHEHFVGFAVATHNPLYRAVRFLSAPDGLDHIDWRLADAGDFRTSDDDKDKIARISAEVLAYRAVPLAAFSRMICPDEATRLRVVTIAAAIAVASMPQITVDAGRFFRPRMPTPG